MKVREWYQLLQENTINKDAVAQAAAYRLINIILTISNVNLETAKANLDLETADIVKELTNLCPNGIATSIWNMLGITDVKKDAYKYYALDMLTNGQYLKPLLGHIAYCVNCNIAFQVDFSEDNFKTKVDEPELEICFKQLDSEKGYNIAGFKYKNLINGDMNIEEALTIFTDVFFILSPEIFEFIIDNILIGKYYITRSMNNRLVLTPYLQSELGKELFEDKFKGLNPTGQPFNGFEVLHRNADGILYKEVFYDITQLSKLLNRR